MSQSFSKIWIVILFFSILIVPLKCLGDILMPPPIVISLLYYPPLILIILGINLVINFFLLAICYLILRKGVPIMSWKFLRYVFFVSVGGFLIDLIYAIPKISLEARLVPSAMEIGQIDWALTIENFLPVFLFLTVIGLALFNYWLSKKYFHLNKKEAIFIGLVIGILGGPIFLYFLANFSIPIYYLVY